MLIAIALIVAGTLHPLIAALEKIRLPRGLALAVVFIGLTALVALIGLLTIPPLVTQLAGIITHAPQLQKRAVAFMEQHALLAPLAASVRNARQRAGRRRR